MTAKVYNLLEELKGSLSPDAFERFQANVKTGDWKEAFDNLGESIKEEGVELSEGGRICLRRLKRLWGYKLER